MDEHCKVRIVVEQNTIYLLCDEAPIANDPSDIAKGYTLVPYPGDDVPTDVDNWQIDYIDWSKVSAVVHCWVPADGPTNNDIGVEIGDYELTVPGRICELVRHGHSSINSVTEALKGEGREMTSTIVGTFMYELVEEGMLVKVKNGKWKATRRSLQKR